jgi:hypothetical protein
MENKKPIIVNTAETAMAFSYSALIILMICLLVNGCSSKKPGPDPRIHYINLDMVIVEKAGYVNSGGKYTSLGKYFLLRGVKDTTFYWEYHGFNNNSLTDSMYYNHKVGDWLHFDYVLKSYRFFHITNQIKCSRCKK